MGHLEITALHGEDHLANRVIACEEGAVAAALELFEREDPATLREAERLVEANGRLSANALALLSCAYDMYWQQRGTPRD